MSTRYQHDIGRGCDRERLERGLEVVDEDTICRWESSWIGEGGPIVDHDDLEVEQATDLGDRHRDVSRADDHEDRLRERYLEEDRDLGMRARREGRDESRPYDVIRGRGAIHRACCCARWLEGVRPGVGAALRGHGCQ